ncbi:MAG TPA: beta-propeller fold lactonase family protein, partial [Actinoplanes sp.]|nr:beta-propeller fold lactonase family protein [Actinoplanes sp.]
MHNNEDIVFVGCYTPESGGEGEGVALLRRDPASGALTRGDVVTPTPSPSFLARHPALPVLYAVNELEEGTVSSWSVAPDGALTALAVRSTGGSHPCHLAVSADGRYLLVANYGSGSVAVFPLGPDGAPGQRTDLAALDGHGPDPLRQEGPHAHMVAPDPDTGEVLVVDLGADRVRRYRVDAVTGRLTTQPTAVVTVARTGPRHLSRHPDGTVLLVGERAANVTWLRPDPHTGRL